ncbi:hypothetical protein FOZ63_013008, partial [Perkinsus olseni]
LESVELSVAGADLDDARVETVLCPAISDTKRGLTGVLHLSDNPALTDEAIIRLCAAMERKRIRKSPRQGYQGNSGGWGLVPLVHALEVTFIGTTVHDDGVADLLAALREKEVFSQGSFYCHPVAKSK